MNMHFKVGYDMETEYQDDSGIHYHVRVGMHEMNTREDLHDSVRNTIGTVRVGWNPNRGERGGEYDHHVFPSQEVVDHFSASLGIPLVPMRYTPDYQVEYRDNRPSAPIKIYRSTWINPEWEAKCKALSNS